MSFRFPSPKEQEWLRNNPEPDTENGTKMTEWVKWKMRHTANIVVTHKCKQCNGVGNIVLLTSNNKCNECGGSGVTVKTHTAGSTPDEIGYWDALRVTSENNFILSEGICRAYPK